MGKSEKAKAGQPPQQRPPQPQRQRQPSQNGRGRRPESREERLQATKAQHRAEKAEKALDGALAKASDVIAGAAKTSEVRDARPGEKVREEGGHAVYRHKDSPAPAGPEAKSEQPQSAPVTEPAPDLEPQPEMSSQPLPQGEAPAEKAGASQKKAPEKPAPKPEATKPPPMELKDAQETPAEPSVILAIFDEMQNRLEGDPELTKRLRQMNLPPELADVITCEQTRLLREMRERLAGVGLAPAVSAAPAAPEALPAGLVPVKEIPCWNKETKAQQDAAAAAWREAQEQKAEAEKAGADRAAEMASWGIEPMVKPEAASEDDSEDETDDSEDDETDDSAIDRAIEACSDPLVLRAACRSWRDAAAKWSSAFEQWSDASDKWHAACDEWHEAADKWHEAADKVWTEEERVMRPLSWYAWLFLVVLVSLLVMSVMCAVSMKEDVLWCDPAAVKEEALAAFLEKPEELAPLRTDWTGCLSAGLASFAAKHHVPVADSRGLLASGRPQADASHEVAASVIEAARTKACGAPAGAGAAK